jgi:hypothetical protein
MEMYEFPALKLFGLLGMLKPVSLTAKKFAPRQDAFTFG